MRAAAADADVRVCVRAWVRPGEPARLSVPPLIAALCAVGLAACAPAMSRPSHTPVAIGAPVPVPLPRRALLAPPPKPHCEPPALAHGDTWLDPGEAARAQLDYERQCYRRAEQATRARLRQLQVSIARTITAIERSAQASGFARAGARACVPQ